MNFTPSTDGKALVGLAFVVLMVMIMSMPVGTDSSLGKTAQASIFYLLIIGCAIMVTTASKK